MSISVYRGSELNRLARRFVDQKSKELKPEGRKASFADWELVINDTSPTLRVRYGIYSLMRAAYGQREKFGIEFGNIAL